MCTSFVVVMMFVVVSSNVGEHSVTSSLRRDVGQLLCSRYMKGSVWSRLRGRSLCGGSHLAHVWEMSEMLRLWRSAAAPVTGKQLQESTINR
jgi:hypothetical protein